MVRFSQEFTRAKFFTNGKLIENAEFKMFYFISENVDGQRRSWLSGFCS